MFGVLCPVALFLSVLSCEASAVIVASDEDADQRRREILLNEIISTGGVDDIAVSPESVFEHLMLKAGSPLKQFSPRRPPYPSSSSGMLRFNAEHDFLFQSRFLSCP
jgi:hypothetical protein